MTDKKSWFSKLDDSVNRKIRFADNSIICGIGKVLIHRKDGKKACITDVLYVPNMRSNLISIGQLLQKGYTMKVEAQTMKVFDSKNMLILKAPLSKQRTFKINISVIEDKCLLFEVKSENWLWHQSPVQKRVRPRQPVRLRRKQQRRYKRVGPFAEKPTTTIQAK